MSLSTAAATNEMPQIQVLAGFGATSANFPWTDISAYVRSGTITRGSNRLAGPIYQYQAGTCSLVLKNGDARFDPDNLSGPYVTTQGLQTVTETITPQGAQTGNPGGGSGNAGQSVSGTFTVPATLNGTTITVRAWAAGGGGGAGSNITQAAAGGGGGGGEFAGEAALAVTPGQSYSYTIGLAGAGGNDTTRTGSDGGDTTFVGDSATVHAHGGKGGQTGTATGTGGSTGQFQGAGGNGGSGSTNTQNNPGGAGGPGGQNSSGTTASGGGGGGSGNSGAPGQTGGTGDGKNPTPGGAATLGGGPGGTGGQPKNNGSAPSAPPGGGGGGGAGERDGGNGAAGQITITYTIIVASSARTEVIPETPIRVVAAYARNATVNFENGLGAWSPTSATITQDTTSGFSLWGQASMKMTPDGVHVNPLVQSEMCQVGTASVISASAWVFTPVGLAHTVKLDINYYNSSLALLQNDSGTFFTPQAGVWTQVTNYNNSPPPVGAVYFALQFKINGTPAASEAVWLDQMVGAPGLAASAYPLFTGYVDAWADAGIMNPNDPGGPQTGPYQGYAETNLTATDAFEPFSLANLATLTNPVDSGNDAGGRIGTILQAIGWPSAFQQIDTSPVIVQGSDYGDSALNLMQTAATTDGGDLFMDGGGDVVFFTRNHVLSATTAVQVQGVFGDRPGTVEPNGTELPYEGIVRVTDNTTLFNDIQITPVSGTDPAATGVGGLEEVTDGASVAQFLFLRSYTNSSTIQMFQADALDLAQWILFIAKDDEDRIDQLVINPQRAPGDMYLHALGRQFTDRIEVWRRPAGMISPIVKPMGIRGISHAWDISAKTWFTTWTLQDYTKYSSFMRLDDLTSGRLGYNAVAWG